MNYQLPKMKALAEEDRGNNEDLKNLREIGCVNVGNLLITVKVFICGKVVCIVTNETGYRRIFTQSGNHALQNCFNEACCDAIYFLGDDYYRLLPEQRLKQVKN